MADITIDFVNAQFDTFQTDLSSMFTREKDHVAALQATIDSGGTVTKEQLQGISDRLTAMDTAVKTFDINTPDPVIPVPAPPPVTGGTGRRR